MDKHQSMLGCLALSNERSIRPMMPNLPDYIADRPDQALNASLYDLGPARKARREGLRHECC